MAIVLIEYSRTIVTYADIVHNIVVGTFQIEPHPRTIIVIKEIIGNIHIIVRGYFAPGCIPPGIEISDIVICKII